MDIEARIDGGEDFVEVIEESVGSCEILLAVIGKGWDSRSESGRRFDNPNDFVRLEIATALKRHIPVIPVCVQGAPPPRAQDLPDELAPLARRQAVELSDIRWRHDFEKLISAIKKGLARQTEKRRKAEQKATQESETAAASKPQQESHKPEPRVYYRDAEPTPMPIRQGASVTNKSPAPVWSKPKPSVPVARPMGPAERRQLVTIIAVIVLVLSAAVITLIVLHAITMSDKALLPSAKGDKREAGSSMGQKVDSPMVYVPGGTFTMGRNDGDEYERPAHAVMVAPFFIDQYEVTNEEYAQFVKATNHPPPPTWSNGSYADSAAHRPVTGVTWDDANAYAQWADKRLPTEEEWEFAARGTDGRRYPWGNEWQDGLANADPTAKGLAAVGSYKGASPFGAFDMVGNAWEWTASPFKAYRVSGAPMTLDDVTNELKGLKVIRGCMYKCNKNQATATYRRSWPANGNYDYSNTGFRCAKDATK